MLSEGSIQVGAWVLPSILKAGGRLFLRGRTPAAPTKGSGAKGDIMRMSPSDAPRSAVEAALRRETELRQRILADRLAELGQGEGGAVGKGATHLPPEAANDPTARGMWERLQEIRRQIADLRRNPPSGLREMLEP